MLTRRLRSYFTVEQLLNEQLPFSGDKCQRSVFHRLARIWDAYDFGMERLLDEQLAFDSYLHPFTVNERYHY